MSRSRTRSASHWLICPRRSVLGAASATAIEAVFDHTSDESALPVPDAAPESDTSFLKAGTSPGNASNFAPQIDKQRTKLPQTPNKPKGASGRSQGSPLAKLWGKGANTAAEIKSESSSEEVEDLKLQLREMREGMARMEALLLKSMKQE